MSKYFKASLDTVSKIITGLVSPIFTLFPIILFFALRNEADKSYLPYFVLLCLMLWVAFAYCILFWVKGYSLAEGQLVIQRQWKNKTYALSEIKSANYITKKDRGFVIRVMGTGGIFGYTGYFTSKQHGRMQWFVTNQEKLIVVELTNGKFICISPDDTDGFLKALSKMLK